MGDNKRLIVAYALYKKFANDTPTITKGEQRYVATWRISDLIADAPTVDAVEVVHGEWRYYSTTMQECSNCHRHTARHKFKYCPHCGAVMEDKYYESTD